jgi:excinuclease ABC subunit B
MGIALHHEVAPHRPGAKGAKGSKREGPRKPTLDEMGPGPESKLYRPDATTPHRPGATSPRSTSGRPGQRGGWKPRGK